MRGFRTYRPPPLDRRVTIRTRENPDGSTVWANARDRRPTDDLANGVEVRGLETIFTIRDRPLPADFTVDHGGIAYRSIGAPMRRGGAEGNLRAVYLELWTERRQRAAMPAPDPAKAERADLAERRGGKIHYAKDR